MPPFLGRISLGPTGSLPVQVLRRNLGWRDIESEEGPMASKRIVVPPGKKLIFRVWRTCPKTGRRLYAPAYGLRAWPILVDA